MRQIKDFYRILDVNFTATSEEIKKSYRQLALKYHPDRNPNNGYAENMFKEIVEAYETLSDPQSRKRYDLEFKNSKYFQEPKKQENSITPKDILKILSQTRVRVVKAGRQNINETGLYTTLNDLLSENNILFLRAYGDNAINKLIMNEVLICSKYLQFERAEKLIIKLVKLAGSDNEAILHLHKFTKKLRRWSYVDRYNLLIKLAAIILIFFIFTLFIETNSDEKPVRKPPANGELDGEFIKDVNTNILTPKEQVEIKRKELLADGWAEKNVENGQLPKCYNFIPKKGKIDNKLEISVGSGTDVSLKLMNQESGKCVRYVYINGGSTYQIKNIPQGIYYLKIAYGKNWFSKVIDGQCIGKFLTNALYSKGEDVMDFNLKYTERGYSIPSFQLELDVISSDLNNSFESENISETEFNQ